MSVKRTYLSKAVCWNRKSIQVATSIVTEVERACVRFRVKAFSGYRTSGATSRSDHRCGYAVDFVGSRGWMWTLYLWAKARRFPYVEWVYTATNKHVHISFKRCP